MNIVDSSAWLEFFVGSEYAELFLAPLQDEEHLLVPVITIYEVFKVMLRELGEEAALQAASAMQRTKVIEVTTGRSVSAATLSLRHSLPMADAMILAAAREFKATLWTLDSHFEGIENVRYFPKKMI